LQQADSYSFSLVLRVLESVVPAAAAAAAIATTAVPAGGAAKKSKGKETTTPSSLSSSPSSSVGLLEISQVFVSAFPHILPSRRLQLYHTLLRSLGEHSLAPVQLLLLLLLLLRGGEGGREEGLLELMDALGSKLSPVQQVLSLADLIEMGRVLLQHLLYSTLVINCLSF
jgi:hypothetical protein